MDRRTILRELGLLDPVDETLRGLAATELRQELHRRGRRLLAKYHPDRNPGNPGAGELFRAASEVLREVETVDQLRAPAVSVTLYPQTSPAGTHLYTRAQQGYFSWTLESSGLRYDARRVVFMKPSLSEVA